MSHHPTQAVDKTYTMENEEKRQHRKKERKRAKKEKKKRRRKKAKKERKNKRNQDQRKDDIVKVEADVEKEEEIWRIRGEIMDAHVQM